MTDDDIRDLARRTAAKYSHRSDPAFIAYTFLPNTLIDFARKLIEADRAELAKTDQPAWHDYPTCAGVWLAVSDRYGLEWHKMNHAIDPVRDPSWVDGSRYFGPLPEDRP